MKEKKKLFGNRFFGLLVRNYVFFTLTNVLIFFVILYIDGFIIEHALDIPSQTLKNQEELLKNGRYDEVDADKIVKGNGWIEILDSNYNVIYRSSNAKEKVNSYTKKEIESISDYYGNIKRIEKYRVKKDDNKSFILLIKKLDFYDDESDATIEILDDSYNILYRFGKFNDKYDHYTEREMEFMTGTYFKKYQIKKYDFIDNEGNNRYLIAKIDQEQIKGLLKLINESSKYMLHLFLVIYILNVTIFIVYLNRKVKRPLVDIRDAMISFTDGKDNQIKKLKGPEEFIQISEAYNEMVAKLKRSEEEREILEAEKQKMLSDISHDLKTPFTIIRGYAKALADGIITNEVQQKKYLNMIYQKTIDVTQLIDLFNEYNKLEHPDFHFNLKRQDLGELCRIYIAERYDYITEQGFNIEVDISDEPLFSNIDGIQIQRALENIISNSMKYNPQGTTIFMGLKQIGEWNRIIIGDDGIGIPDEISDNIFDAFVVGDDSRNSKQGTGLGLAIAKKIVEKNNGRISLAARDEDRYKTKFKILIPKSTE
ncbi:ATP-binding protein [Tissierellaceae bacterium HCP3S3_D8]